MKTVLIIEDNPTQADMLQFFIEQSGYEALIAGSGEAGLALLRKTKGIGLITLDINLPGISGLHLLSTLKSDPILRHIPVVIISALGQKININKAIEAGADDYLVKPITRISLNFILKKFLE
jgi:CheY-like chemotaxis protein